MGELKHFDKIKRLGHDRTKEVVKENAELMRCREIEEHLREKVEELRGETTE